MPTRFVAIGAHLPRKREDGPLDVKWLSGGEIDFSTITFDPSRGTADPAVIRSASAARSALTQIETFIAIRYGVSVGSAAELQGKCASFIPGWRARLEETQGLIELTLKVASADPARALRPDRKNFTSGRLYLEALAGHRRSAPAEPGFAEAVERLFTPHLREHRWLSRADSGQELVMLAARGEFEAIQSAARTLKELHPQVPFLLSGPWPLEEFADAG